MIIVIIDIDIHHATINNIRPELKEKIKVFCICLFFFVFWIIIIIIIIIIKVLKETLRLHPPLTGSCRDSPANCVLAGVKIPGDTPIYVSYHRPDGIVNMVKGIHYHYHPTFLSKHLRCHHYSIEFMMIPFK